MHLDIHCLREARLENVERLARALGLSLPAPTRDERVYARRLFYLVLRKLEDDAARDRHKRSAWRWRS